MDIGFSLRNVTGLPEGLSADLEKYEDKIG